VRFHEIVIRKVKRNRGLEMLKLFAERECESRKPLAMRSHDQIRAFKLEHYRCLESTAM
jgi:hypothetical protein